MVSIEVVCEPVRLTSCHFANGGGRGVYVRIRDMNLEIFEKQIFEMVDSAFRIFEKTTNELEHTGTGMNSYFGRI